MSLPRILSLDAAGRLVRQPIPELAAVSAWTLATRDAHGVYAPFGFRPITDPQSMPERWMVLRHPPPAPRTTEREETR